MALRKLELFTRVHKHHKSWRPWGGGGRSCEPGPDGLGKLCTVPAILITLAPGQELNWEFDLSSTLGEGSGDFRLTVSWFGSAIEAEALKRIDTGTANCRT